MTPTPFFIKNLHIKQVVSDTELKTEEQKARFQNAVDKNDIDTDTLFDDRKSRFQEYLEDNFYLIKQKMYIKNKGFFNKEFEYIEVDVKPVKGFVNLINASLTLHYVE